MNPALQQSHVSDRDMTVADFYRVRGAVLGVLHVLTRLTFTVPLYGRHSYCPHFRDEESGSPGFPDTLKVTKPKITQVAGSAFSALTQVRSFVVHSKLSGRLFYYFTF